MTTPTEIELKFELAPAGLAKLEKIPLLRGLDRKAKRAQQVSVYFDTDERNLYRQGLLLRVRRTGDGYIQTIKASGNTRLFERDEWESEIEGETPDLRFARGTALEPLLDDKLCRGLKPIFETRVERTVYPLENGQEAIALALDRGEIRVESRSAPLCEIELELERGSREALFDAGRELVREIPAQLTLASKSARGYALLDGGQDAPVKSAAVELERAVSTRDAFRIIGRACLKQIVENRPAVLAGNRDGVHQMRVGLRRLRAAMSLFADLLDDSESGAIKAELKWLSRTLGPAREFDVLLKRVVAPVETRHQRWDGVPSLSRALARQGETALTRAEHSVASARFRTLTFDVAAWLETGRWVKPSDELVRARGDAPAETFAADELDRRWRKIRKQGKRLAELDARRRHRLRIRTKKMRYAAEFFTDLFSGKRATKRREKFLRALERLQDGLGDLNDIAVHEKLIAGMGTRRPRNGRKRAFAAGLLTGREDARFDSAAAAAVAAYDKFARRKPFWR